MSYEFILTRQNGKPKSDLRYMLTVLWSNSDVNISVKSSGHGEAFYCTLLSINKHAHAACSQSGRLKAYIDGIESNFATQESSDEGLPSVVRLCVMPLYAFIWLSSELTIEAQICHCTGDLRKKVLWSHIGLVLPIPVPIARGGTKCSAGFSFNLNFIQNVCVCVYIWILGSRNNPLRPQPPPPRYISSSRGI